MGPKQRTKNQSFEKHRLIISAVIPLALVTSFTQADSRTWIGTPPGGVFSDSSNWLGGLVPAAGDMAVFAGSPAFGTVRFESDVANSDLFIRQGSGTFDLNGHTYQLTATADSVRFGGIGLPGTAVDFVGAGTLSTIDFRLLQGTNIARFTDSVTAKIANGFGSASGTATIEISNATVECKFFRAGDGGVGTMIVSGPTSLLRSTQPGVGFFNSLVGGGGAGSLLVNNGGRVEIVEGLGLGTGASAVGFLQVADPGSSLTTGGIVEVGGSGNGTLQILNGATMHAGGDVSTARTQFRSARVVVASDGETSRLNIARGLFIAGRRIVEEDYGSATVEIRSGGEVNATETKLFRFGRLIVDGGVLNTGSLSAQGGTIEVLNGGRINSVGPVRLDGVGTFAATITGADGTIDGDVTLAGRIAPGKPVGQLSIDGNLSLASTADFQVDVAGLDSKSFDQLHVSGAAQLAGSLTVRSSNGYVPLPGQSFEVLRFGSSTGSFVINNQTGSAGLSFSTMITGTSLRIVGAGTAGDANLDGVVNISDFASLAAHFNSVAIWTSGDFTGDGVTNISDFALLAANFGTSSPAVRSSVPEPAMGSVLGICVSVLLGRSRRAP